jgi:RimJ/RimL family protein N-acetyltransferase
MPEGIQNEPSIEAESELKLPHRFDWVDTGGVRGEKGATYEGVVRYAVPQDREGVKAVEKDKQKHRMRRGEREYDLTIDPDMEEFDRIFEEPDKLASLVLTIDGEVIAHIDFGNDSEHANTVEFGTVVTTEKYQRNGFMSKLLSFAEREAQKAFGAETIRISTQEENKKAIDYYCNPK